MTQTINSYLVTQWIVHTYKTSPKLKVNKVTVGKNSLCKDCGERHCDSCGTYCSYVNRHGQPEGVVNLILVVLQHILKRYITNHYKWTALRTDSGVAGETVCIQARLYLEASFLAVGPDHQDIGRLNARSDEGVQILVCQVTHLAGTLQKKLYSWLTSFHLRIIIYLLQFDENFPCQVNAPFLQAFDGNCATLKWEATTLGLILELIIWFQ